MTEWVSWGRRCGGFCWAKFRFQWTVKLEVRYVLCMKGVS